MQLFTRFSQLSLLCALSLSLIGPVFSEQAPVYDVESLPQFESSSNDSSFEQPPPPPPPPASATGQGDVFVFDSTQNSQPHGSRPGSSLSTPQRLNRLEQQIENMQNNNATSRVESLQNEIQALRSQVEQLNRQVQQLQTQQKTLYSDLDARLSKQASMTANNAASSLDKTKETAAVKQVAPLPGKPLTKPVGNETKTESTTVATKSVSQPNVAEEQEIYQTAYSLIKQKKYAEAVIALQKMLNKYPSGQFAANAHYWLGELNGLMGKNDLALKEFNAVVETFPDSPRVSDAQLKVGLIYAAQFKWTEAKTSFKKIINRYPGTASARLASEQLKQIKQAGH
jgi:tol-pal system protein YbgF